jgi:hypothetical protein
MFAREDNTERFFIPAYGPDDEALKDGFRWLFDYARENGSGEVAVEVPSVGSISNLGRVIGDGNAKKLVKDRHLQVDGVRLTVFTEKTAPHRFEVGPVLAAWVDDKRLDKLDVLNAPALCAIPWDRTDIDGWKTAWNPANARTGDAAGSGEPVGDPVLRAALKSLSQIVNLSTGITHPSDKASAVQLFRILRTGGVPFRPEEVKAIAVQAGWEPRHARDLASVAERIAAGKVVQARGGTMWREDILDHWRADAVDQG